MSFCSSLTANPKAAAPDEAYEGLNNEMSECNQAEHSYNTMSLFGPLMSSTVNIFGNSIDWSLILDTQLGSGK